MAIPLRVRILAAPILFGPLSASLLAQSTQVGGPILSNTTWTLASSPYEVTTPIIIGNDATLTIEPGVRVEVDGGKQISVGSPAFGDGTMIARGTAASPIRFTTGTGVAGDWDRLLFGDEAVDANLVMETYVSGSILEYCIFELGGGNSVPGVVHLASSSPLIRACTFQDNVATGLYADLADGATSATPSLRVEGCVLQRNTSSTVGGGMALYNGSGHLVSGSIFEGNVGSHGGGIWVSSPDPTAPTQIVDCQFVGNWGGSGGGINASSPFCYLWRNEVRGNVATYGGGMTLGNGVFQVNDSMIVGNQAVDGGGIFVAWNTQHQWVTILRNTIANNTASRDGGGLWDNRQSNKPMSTANLWQNSVINNVAGRNGGGLWWNSCTLNAHGNTISNNHAGSDGGGFYNNGWTTLSETTFANNTAGSAGGGIYTQRTITDLAGDPTNNLFNTFLGNAAPQGDAIFNNTTFSPTGSGDTPASFVCWGPEDPNTNANRIWDFFDDPTRGIVAATNHVPCGPFANLGAGLPGAAGVPALSGSGPLTANSTFTILMQNAAPHAGAVLLVDVSASFVHLPSLGGVIVPLTMPVVVYWQADAAGNASLSLPLGTTVPTGLRFYYQSVVADLGAANGGLAFSNAVVGIFQ